jgi:hypothetical protein
LCSRNQSPQTIAPSADQSRREQPRNLIPHDKDHAGDP